MGNFDKTSWFYKIFKMEITTWLSLLIAVITLGTPVSSSEPRVVCYYTNWSVYRPGTARFNPQNINPYLCTHLVYAFGGFTKDNTLKPFDKYQDIEKGGYAKFTGLKTYNKNLKTMLAIGGWNEGSTRFSPMVGSRERRKEFVRNVIKFLRQNRFDGLDLDWEYPAFRDGGKPKDRENYAKLVKELREEFDREAEKTGKPRLLLTMAVPAGIEYIQKGFDVKTLNQYLDWMNLLSYDYHSAFEPAVNHHAPLYPLEEPNEYSVDNELNIDYTIKFYIESGADPDKLVLGIPTYGRSYTLFNPDAVEIGSPADGPGEQGDATREKGYLAYYEICEALKPKTKKRQASEEEEEEYSEEEEEEEWTVMHPNSDAMGPVAYKGNQWVGYDDVDIVKKKAEYVAENGLGGIMFWSIDNDDFRGTCHGKPYPLIEAAKESYFAKIGTTVTKQKPSSGSRTSTRRKNRPRSSTTTTTTTPKPVSKSSKRKQSVTSTTPAWNIITPEPPTTPDPGSDFKCVDEGFYPHPRDCKKYFWCLDSGPSNLGIVAHQFTCPSGLYFNKGADSCDFARNVPCKKSDPTTKAPTTKAATTTTTTTTTTTRKPIRLSTKSSSLFRTTSSTTTTPEPESEEYEEETVEDPTDEDAEDPRVIKELIDLIRKVGGIEQLEKQLGFGENNQASTDGTVTSAPVEGINKKLYQKVLERTRGQNKYTGINSILQGSSQNSRRGPQNAGIPQTNDRDKLTRKDRPQYTTINRQRGSTSTTEAALDSDDIEDESQEEVQQNLRAKSVDTESRVGTTAKPLQYVNIRRARPTTLGTSDTADDTASRNALFERSEPLVTVSDTPNSLDILSARRENVPEYVTIRRQRPTTEETTTVQYQNSEEEEEEEIQETALEREISTQPQYTSIVRSRSTQRPTEEPSSESPVLRVRSTTVPTEETSSPDPTTVLAVQISSLLNSPSSSEIEIPETESPVPTTVAEPTTTTTTTTTTTQAPASSSTRRTLLRRRGSTIPTPSSTAAPSSATQVSPRNYTFVSRRRPLPRPNEISEDSDETTDVSRKIRSTTPDSREVDGAKPRETGPRRFRSRFQASQTARIDDSVPAAASPVSRGQFKPQALSEDEVISLTPVDVEPQFVPRQSFSARADRRFRRPTASTTTADVIPDSEGSAATVETRRPNLLPRGRSRFTISSTTESSAPSGSVSSIAQRRPTFARFSPRPFTRTSSSTASSDTDDENTAVTEESSTQRIAPRLPFGRIRPSSTAAPGIVARKLPFPSRQSTTQQTLANDDDDDEPESRSDDILLSESAREEKEHEQSDVEDEAPKRRVIIKKLRASEATDETLSTEAIPIDESGKKRFRVIRRRPTSTTAIPEAVISTEASTEAPAAFGPQRVRKIIRKKIKPVEDEPEITVKSVSSVNTLSSTSSTTTEEFNYGEKTRTPSTTTTEIVTEPIIEEVTEFYKEKKVKIDVQGVNIETKEEATEKTSETEDKIIEITTTAPTIVESDKDAVSDDVKNTNNNEETVTDTKSDNVESSDVNSNTDDENKETSVTSNSDVKIETESNTETENKPDVAVISEGKVDISDNIETTASEASVTETDSTQPETTTVSTTISSTSSSRTRLPYRPRKKLYTPSTEPSVPSTSKTYSRKYNPGVYTSPSTVDRPQFRPIGTTRRPFSSKIFTRKPFTPRTTQRVEDEEEYDEELLEEEPEPDNPFVFVPPNQLFTRKPDSEEEEDEGVVDEGANSEELLDEEDDGPYDEEVGEQEETPTRFALTTRRPGFRPRVVNSNTFRTTTSTTELPRRFPSSQNRTGIITRFSSNKPASDGKKRVQNVPPGYNSPVSAPRPKVASQNETQEAEKESKDISTTTTSGSESETTTAMDDDYLTVTETLTENKELTTSEDVTATNTIETETATFQMEVDNSTDDYLESTEGTTNYPTTQDITTIAQTEPEIRTTIVENTVANTVSNTEITTEPVPTTVLTTTTTTPAPPPPPIIKTQFDKLFSISRVVEVNSKLDKHRVNKNNETTFIEEGKIMVEKKPVVDKIGEVSRYSLIKIVEDEIPIYLTKFGHVYPVEHPPENHIRIDEARNARALVETFPDTPRENLVASESVNEAYRHIKKVSDSKADESTGHVEHVPSDDFLSYVNDENKNDKEQDGPLYAQWQFVPAAFENEKVRAAKSFEIVTPRSMLTNPSTLPLEGLFKTENPLMARKLNDEKNQPFLVYSASVPSQQEEANIVKISVLKPETGRSIVTFAKGQEFKGASTVEDASIKYPINISVVTSESTTASPSPSSSTTSSNPSTTTFTTTTKRPSSPIMDLLSTTQATTEISTTTSTDAPSTTEIVPEEITTVKLSPLDNKRAKYAFPRRPIIKPSNFTRLTTAPRTVKKINATVISNLNQKSNKTAFSPSKSRFSGNRVQNVPVDVKKKSNSPKAAPKIFTTTKSYTTESPKTTTERKLYFKPIRPNFRPGFIPRKTTPPVTGDT